MARRFNSNRRPHLLLLLSGKDVCGRCKTLPTDIHGHLCFRCRYRTHIAMNNDARRDAGMNGED